eukprot:TRINITY_DN77989_c0_g1_i1.p1 TRINITY_DN77989_c0_g1~~TRINITY_DN77989_c0_g1_i1.p1  ORF type:complete len:166 (+),score=16.71 TRINITY_DN77989_c0_g1_i1:47-544(+)
MASLWCVVCVSVCSGLALGSPRNESETANELGASFHLSQKVVIGTGGAALSRQSATVAIAGHSVEKSEIIADELRNTTSADVRSLLLDVGVRAFADKFLTAFDKLHTLTNISHRGSRVILRVFGGFVSSFGASFLTVSLVRVCCGNKEITCTPIPRTPQESTAHR